MIIIVTTEQLQKIRIRINDGIRWNWGFPFIAGFILLLFAAAIFSAAEWIYIAESLAVCAYFSLVAGVALELISLSRKRSKKCGAT